ncbi:MAG: excisionase family DNA binding protein [Candidatus Latescibacterota bacterium]|jgi:excisionase family DNA binding protein
MNYKKLLTTGDVASHCQVSYETVSNWIKGGKLKSHATPGRHRRISREDFIDFLSVHDMPPLDETPSTPERRRLLLVDDEPAILNLIIRYFQRHEAPYELCTANDGFEAGLQMARFRPDLVVLDLMMPHVDGFRVCKLIRSNPQMRDTGILVVTGYASDENRTKAMDQGADSWLAKPFEPAELARQVEQILTARGKLVLRHTIPNR